MKVEDILKPVYPVKEYKSGNITTRIQTGPDFKITRSINFAGREIPLPSLLDTIQREKAVREPTITTSLSPVGHIKAVRKPMEDNTHGNV